MGTSRTLPQKIPKKTYKWDKGIGKFRTLMQREPLRRPLVYSYSYEDTIKGQTYVTFDGLQVDRGLDTELIANDTGGTVNNTLSTVNDAVAQSFTPLTDIWVTTISIYADSSSGLVGDIDAVMTIQETTAGEPTGVKLDSDSKTNLPDTGTYAWHTFTFDYVLLKAGAVYAMVVTASDFETTGFLALRAADNTANYAGGSIWISADAEGSWAEDTSEDQLFRIRGYTSNPYILFPAANITSTDDTTTQFTNSLEINFDFIVGNTMAIKGLILLDISGSASYTEIDLIDYDGTTETSLITGSGYGGAATIAMDLTSWKKIKRGNTLRLNVKAKRAASGTTTINHSGNNLKLHLPFRVELPD